MRFPLILLMNLAAIASTGTLGLDSLLSKQPTLLTQYCPCLVARLKKFANCDVPSTFNAMFTKEAIPYICLLSLNTIIEICREGGPLVQDACKLQAETTKCPFYYATKTSNLDLDLTKAADYFKNKENCRAVCNFSNETSDDCKFMTSLNEAVTRLYEKDEGAEKQTAPLQSLPSIRQNTPQNASKHFFYDQRQKNENVRAQIFGTKVEDPIIHIGERLTKKPVNIEATSENESKGREEKADYAVIGAQLKPNTSESSKELKFSNNLNISNSGIGNRPEKEVSETISTHVNKNKINDNIHEHTQNGNNNKSNNNNKFNNNKEDEENIKDRLSIGRVHLTKTDVPPFKAISDTDLSSTSGGKKDYIYGSTIKSSKDEAVDDEGDDGDVDVDNNNKYNNNNEDDNIVENHRKQDTVSNREYESGRVLNPKELYNGDGLFQAEDSHFSIYFLMTISVIIIGYIIYHNKNKIVAYALEGRRGRNGRRRPTSASYRKLDCNLEEAIASNPSHASITNVVY